VKLLIVVFLLVSSCAFAEDFSIYPLTPEPLEFSTRLEPLFIPNEYALEFPLPTSPSTLEPYSMEYIYPDEATLYSMEFVEPDLTTDFSMYTAEPTMTVPELELEFPEP
jgi:hypothetical protein